MKKMVTENNPFELVQNPQGQWDIIDNIESKNRNAICIYNDLGVHPYSAAPALCELLNNKQKMITELVKMIQTYEDEILRLKGRIQEYEEQIQTEEKV